MATQWSAQAPPPHQHDGPTDLVDKLTAAIQAGDVNQAQYIASLLSSQKVKLCIQLPQEEFEQRGKETEFNVKVHVEDREAKGCVIQVMVKACDTIADLKKKMMLKFDFPLDVQRWIIGRKIPGDHEKLSQCGVKGPGHTLYLYLVTARSVGLTREQHQLNKQAFDHGGSSINHAPHMPLPAEMLQASNMEQPLRYPSHTIPSSGEGISPNASGIGQSELFDNVAMFGSGHHQHVEPMRQVSKTSITSGSSLLQSMLGSNPAIPSPPPAGPTVEQLGEPNMTEISFMQIPSHNALNAAGPVPVPIPQAPVGWTCPQCTFLNLPLRPGCEMCSGPCPQGYQVPPGYEPTPVEMALLEEQRKAEQSTREEALVNYQNLLATDDLDLVPNPETFTCPICFDDFDKGEGIILRECLHTFCRDCLNAAVQHSDEAYLKCPYQDDNFSCEAMLQDREIRSLVTDELYAKYLQRGLDQAENQASNSYHCKTSDCQGWCLYEDQVNFFQCPVCYKENCLTCKAIHEGMNCKQYQEDLERRSLNDTAAKQTKEMLEHLVATKEAMHCPQCQVIVQKKGGCDWIRCSICKLEICWVTQMPRWGPRGDGDTSGGCGCRINGKKCHRLCINCH